MRTHPRSTMIALATAAVVAVAVVAFFVLRGDPSRPATSPGASPGPSASASTPAPRPSAPAVSPLTGRKATADRPVLAVKIDNVRPARPQTGVDRADVVYVEPVEGGLSRIMAIFSADLPAQIGPVRSARASDLELLAQYGHPGLVYSGANGTVQAAIRRAPVVNLSPDQVPSAFRRSSAHAAPHNLMVDPQRLLDRAGSGRASRISPATDIGFRFGAPPSGKGTPTKRKVVRYGAATTTFTWSARRNRWDVSLDGSAARTTSGARLGASTVVVQYTKITNSELHDVLGNPTPYTHTVGSGRAVVLRDGVAFAARWERATAQDGTTFTTSAGDELPFAVGPVWVIYAKG